MADITVSDCEKLYAQFVAYTETAEQHEFALLAVVNIMLDATMAQVRACGEVRNQKDTRAMFRVVLKVIGEDYSKYMEVPDGTSLPGV